MKRAITLKRPKGISTKSLDRDNPLWTEAMLGPPHFRRGRGPQRTPTKVATTIRLDRVVLEYFQSKGAGYQTRINEALRGIMQRGRSSRAARRRSRKS